MNEIRLTAKDFTTDQEVRWCPGCGDYAILKAIRAALADIGRAPDDVVFVSGIGCAARLPYYISSYGFHTIHGRAPAIATGIKLANPDLDVWVAGGDGDFLSIGGNHLLHALRRNVDLNLLLFNNAVYGLTKGQYSPTSYTGTRTPSTPDGSVDTPVNAALFALGAGARFVARSGDTLMDHLPGVLKQAHAHAGASFVEILQNCIVYNDAVFDHVTDKKTGADHAIRVEHGKPMIYGREGDRGLVIEPGTGTVNSVVLGDGLKEEDLSVHDETNFAQAAALAAMDGGHLPMALGVLYNAPAPDYTSLRSAGFDQGSFGRDELDALLKGGATWTVEPASNDA